MELSHQQRNLIKESLENFNEEANIYTHYSGRSMYGKKCFGITTEQYTNPISVMMEIATELSRSGEEDLAKKMADCVREDNMGLGAIAYFPTIEWGHEEVFEEDEDE